ncbi:hypothetical protein [Nocardia sp. NBC_00403]|uniref:hypothetical protein n=1 Tax=Nocardia sp. NBC_00403 TaxID=2975990 RepID=UPI002E20572D
MSDHFGGPRRIIDDVTLRLTDHLQDAARARAELIRGHSRTLDLGTRQLVDRDQLNANRLNWYESIFTPQHPPGPNGRRFAPYTPSAAELEMRSRVLTDMDRLTDSLPESANGVYIMRSGHDLQIYKPAAEETFGLRNWLPHKHGSLAIREVAGYRVFEMMGFPRVPPTALGGGPRGLGSKQQHMPLGRSKPASKFRREHQQQAAAGHFVIGASDAKRRNFQPLEHSDSRPSEEDDLVLYDLGHSIPERSHSSSGYSHSFEIHSDFVNKWAGETLDDNVMAGVDRVTPDMLGSALEDLRLIYEDGTEIRFSDDAINGVLGRHHDLKTTGGIPSRI